MQSAPPASGFALRLAAKDATLLADLADMVGNPAPIAHTLANVYSGAAIESPDSDFTSVARYQRSQAV
jgi:3-hydroxyisobutyrate dehydrogenase-like beta-hydroxyacid dehydrogenase